MQKKILSGILALSMLCGTAFMAACESDSKKINASIPNNLQQQQQTPPIGNPVTPPVDDRPVDTYDGVLSESTYQSEYLAASAYVTRELKGVATVGDLYDYKVDETELSVEEISALNMGETQGNILSVRKMRVQYVNNDLSDIQEKEVYLISLDNGEYQYFVPKMVTGEALDKSYFDLAASTTLAYSSVTITMTNEENMHMSMSYGSDVESSKKTNGVWKISGDTAYYKATIQDFSDGKTTTSTIEEYIVRDPSNPKNFIAVMISNGEFYAMDYPLTYTFENIAKTDDNYLMAALAMLEFAISDHSYFEKADFGFRTSANKMQAYSNDIILPMVAKTMNENFGHIIDVSSMQFTYGEQSYVNYHLKANTLNKQEFISDVTCSHSAYGITMDLYSKGSLSYSDYGKTVVTIPANVQELINNY